MRKVVIFSTIALILGLGGYFYWIKRPMPELDTKFAVSERKSENVETNKSSDISVNGAVVKESGNSALLPNPNHTYQTFNNCGPATLSMMLSLNGKSVSQKELGDQMRPYQIPSGDNDDKTIFTYEFVEWAKKYGFNSVGRVNGDIELLKTFTANGIPVVVKTWLHPGEDIGHFRIVRGFDEEKKVIIQDDSFEGPNRRISYFDFLSMWQPFNYDYIIVYNDDQADLVEAIIGEEIDEVSAWQNALVRAQKEHEIDPSNPYPKFNMSTAYYHIGEYEKSVGAFEEVQTSLPKRMLWYQIEPILAYKELKDYDRVFQITQNILDNGNRAYSELYVLRGDIYLLQGKRDEARSEYELALTYNKNLEKAQETLNSL